MFIFEKEYDFFPGSKVLLDLKHWDREIGASLNGVEIKEGEVLEVASIEGNFVLIKEFNQTLPWQYLDLVCEVCQKNPAFRKGGHTKCLSCARSERDRLREELVAILSVEQLEALAAFEEASDDLSSMSILD